MSSNQDLFNLFEEEKSVLEETNTDTNDLAIQQLLKRLEAVRYKSDTTDRKWLAIWTAILVSVWLMAVLVILIFQGIWHLQLSDTVLITLLGTTTLNVLGLSFIVLRGHFKALVK